MTRWALAVCLLLAAGSAAGAGRTIPGDFAAQVSAVEGSLRLQAHGGFKLASYDEREALLDLLRDPDAAVRRWAVRALKNYVAQTSYARDRVLEVYRNESEDDGVRYEAAKTLSVVANYGDVRERLAEYARRGRDPALRAVSYKALYFSAASTSYSRDILREAAKQESNKEVRLGAIWGLFLVSNNYDVRDALLDIVRNESDTDIRTEALKSLYHAMAYSEVRDRIYDLARDTSQDAALRYPAILLLSAVINSHERSLLVELARRERNPELREAAVMALNPADERIIRYFHLTQRTDTGRYLDPLERE